MEGVGADFDWTLGQFSVKKAGTTTNSQQAKFIVDQLNAEMMGLSMKINPDTFNFTGWIR